jgi:hypothetical protein
MAVPDLEKNDQRIQLFLSKRFNFVFNTTNPFVAELLKFNSLVIEPAIVLEKKIKIETDLTQTQIAEVVKYLSELNNSDKKIAQMVDVDHRTVPGLMDGIASGVTAWKKVARKLETPKMVRQLFTDLDEEEVDHIVNLLK